MLDYRAVKDWPFGDIVSTYTERDTIIYALGAGFGADPTDPNELRFTYENGLRALPSMATIFGSPGPWWRDPRTGVDYARNLHAEQDLVMFAPLPVAGTMIGRNRVTALHDRGAERGALAEIERDIVDQASGRLVARSRRIEVLRSAGGFSAVSGVSDARPQMLPPIEEAERTPDVELDVALSPRAGLIYRLSGDYNPLHVDPQVARTPASRARSCTGSEPSRRPAGRCWWRSAITIPSRSNGSPCASRRRSIPATRSASGSGEAATAPSASAPPRPTRAHRAGQRDRRARSLARTFMSSYRRVRRSASRDRNPA